MPDLDALACVIDDVVAPHATDVDQHATFPGAALDALGAAGHPRADVLDRRRRRWARPRRRSRRDHPARRGVRLDGDGRDDALRGHRRDRSPRAPRACAAEIAAGEHLATLAFSEVGLPQPLLGAAGHGPLPKAMPCPPRRPEELGHLGRSGRQLRLVEPARQRGGGSDDALARAGRRARAAVAGTFDGLGLRGQRVESSGRRRDVGPGPDAISAPTVPGSTSRSSVVLPWFLVLSAAASVGFMRSGDRARPSAPRRALGSSTSDQALAEQPLPRAAASPACGSTRTHSARALDRHPRGADAGREDATLRVLEVKAAGR